MTTVEIGYNKRTWVTFEIKDVTPDEIEVLEGFDEDDQVKLLKAMDKADRLVEQSEHSDDNPEIFNVGDGVDMSVIGIGTDEHNPVDWFTPEDNASRKPHIGDLADHKSGTLDPREVAEVSDNGEHIKIRIFTLVTDWLPADNYTFQEPRS